MLVLVLELVLVLVLVLVSWQWSENHGLLILPSHMLVNVDGSEESPRVFSVVDQARGKNFEHESIAMHGLAGLRRQDLDVL